ncbi:fibroblast growth factor receptor substrate 3 [Procambarus clarkii]|uniref:fibroblast growth factor receptor substrate 3 n=1 Tax=Procambarus clarkii TaxID=6728 RepID=UPI003744597A
MHRYGYTNTSWSEDGLRVGDMASKAQFRRGIQTSFIPYPMPEMEEWQFPVILNPETRQRLGLRGEGTLLVKPSSITLVVNGYRLCEWSLSSIRRFGYSTSNFHFEAGRRAATGEGLFTFLTNKGKRIYLQIMQYKSFYQFDLLCQRGLSPDQIIQTITSREEEQDRSTLRRAPRSQIGVVSSTSQAEFKRPNWTSQPDLTKPSHISQPDLIRPSRISQPDLLET